MSHSNSRAAAAEILSALLSGKGSLSTHLKKYDQLPDYSLLQETCFGACRWFYQLDYIIAKLLSKPLKKKDRDLRCLLIVGLYQLRELSLPDYAVINETVSASLILGKPWGKGLVNAVLRNYLRRRSDLDSELERAEMSVRFSHPQWLAEEVEMQWPDHFQTILSNNNLRSPMTLRVNQIKAEPQLSLQKLRDAGMECHPGKLSEMAIYLESPAAVTDIPGFLDGELSVQDEASQLVPGLLQLGEGLRVLDACAAPGGKTCHILESERSLTSCVAIDRDARRIEKIRENLQRLELTASLLAGDAIETQEWWDGVPFDRVLLDAPCSATGVIRRHSDIKLLASAENIASLVNSQRKLLKAIWECLSPGGLLLYTTCSILRQENEYNIAHFLETTDNAKYESITADWGVECSYGRQLLPGSSNEPDGFFYCLLRKI